MQEAKSDYFERKEQELGVSLNAVQKQAVLHTDGPLLLLASPGSGKTTTLIMKIGYLIEEKKVSPARIKAVTFSRASAQDMKERFVRFFPAMAANPVDFSTIHRLAFEIVRRHFHKQNIRYEMIEGDEEQGADKGADNNGPSAVRLHKKFILRRIYQELNDEFITEDQMEELATYISYVKNKLIPEAEWGKVKCDVPQAELILREYEKRKRTFDDRVLVDYDDMLTHANDVLVADAEILGQYQRRYDYVLTDESQDTSLVQHAIIEKLVRPHGNLCVVADEDQSIYAWRAAEPKYLLDFAKVYPQARILKMEQNYRSSRNIVETANCFIKRNKNRYDKNMFTRNPEHEDIQWTELPDYDNQATYLRERLGEIANLADAAILYRNNSSSIALVNEFDRASIPFYIKDGDNRFFSHWVVKDVLDYMRMSFTDRRPEILERIYRKLNAYLTKDQIATVVATGGNESVFDTLLGRGNVPHYQAKQLLYLKEAFERMRGLPPREAIAFIRDELGYDKEIEKLSKRLGFKQEYLLGILNTLDKIAADLDTMEEFAARLKHLETEMKRAKFRKDGNAVTLSTLHSSKGLEFERVFMIDLVEGIIPSDDDMERVDGKFTDKMEEAVRLFYVGMTRAERELELLSYRSRDGKKTRESRFVKAVRDIQNPPPPAEAVAPSSSAMPHRGQTARGTRSSAQTPPNPNAIKSARQLEEGANVRHRVFGVVPILEIDGDRIRVKATTGEKELSIATCLEMGLLESIVKA